MPGGAHHKSYNQNLCSEHLLEFTEMTGVKLLRIGKNTDIYRLKNELGPGEVSYN